MKQILEDIEDALESTIQINEVDVKVDVGEPFKLGDETATIYVKGVVFGQEFEVEEDVTVEDVEKIIAAIKKLAD